MSAAYAPLTTGLPNVPKKVPQQKQDFRPWKVKAERESRQASDTSREASEAKPKKTENNRLNSDPQIPNPTPEPHSLNTLNLKP